MGYKNLLDMHVHTENSPDGIHSAMRMCEAAVKGSVRSVTFCDHCETDIYEKENFAVSMQHAFVEVAKAKSAFTGTILVNNGIELGQPVFNTELADSIVARFNYDQVISSIHNLRNREDFAFIDYGKEDPDKLLECYFDEMKMMTEWGNFDVLAHMTYPLRYMEGEQGIKTDISKFEKKIDGILKDIIEKNIALEVNTSGLRQKIGKTLPDEEIVSRYRQLGGQLITVGSDAHSENDVGSGIEDGMKLIERCGFKEITLFGQRQPIQIKIE